MRLFLKFVLCCSLALFAQAIEAPTDITTNKLKNVTKRQFTSYGKVKGITCMPNLKPGGCAGGRFNNLTTIPSKIKASEMAQLAAAEAMAAVDAQKAAGKAAAHRVKIQFAEKAMRAAKAAEAAMMSKQQITEQLQQELRDIESTIVEDTSSLHNAEQHVESSATAAQEARAQVNILAEALQIARSYARKATQVATEALEDVAAKAHMVATAKDHIQNLLRQLYFARIDYIETKRAAVKAAIAAHEAKLNANRRRRLVMHFIPQA